MEKSDKRIVSYFMRNDAINSPHLLPESELDYDTDWNMLMPVVEKIVQIHNEKFRYDPVQMANGIFPEDNDYMDVICLPVSTPISQVYKAVVDFLKVPYSQPPRV